MEIKRNKYLNRLISKMNNGLIKVITGIRRSGKSYLLFNLFYDHLISVGVPEECVISIPLDDIDYEEYCDPYALYEYIKGRIVDKNQQYYIFIDEAQYDSSCRKTFICEFLHPCSNIARAKVLQIDAP